MYQDTLSAFSQLNKKAMESTQELTDIQLKAWEQFTSKQLELADYAMKTSVRQMNIASDSKDAKDAMAEQAKLYEEFTTKMMEGARDTMGIANGMRDQLKDWMQKGIDSTVEEMKKASAPSA